MNERTPFETVAGIAAIVGGLCVFFYSISLVVIAVTLRDGVTGLRLAASFLMIGSLVLTLVWVALYERLRTTDASFALWALIMGIIGHIGSVAFGGYDLAFSVSGQPRAPGGFINQASPSGLLTFGVVGLSLLAIAWLMVRGGMFPRALGYLGYLLAVLSIYIYPARVTIMQLMHPALAGPILLMGFLVAPIFYIWTGLALLRGTVPERVAATVKSERFRGANR